MTGILLGVLPRFALLLFCLTVPGIAVLKAVRFETPTRLDLLLGILTSSAAAVSLGVTVLLLAHAYYRPVLLVAQRVVELRARDLVAADLRDVLLAGFHAPDVRVDAEERERKRDDCQDDLRDALVPAYEIEHE